VLSVVSGHAVTFAADISDSRVEGLDAVVPWFFCRAPDARNRIDVIASDIDPRGFLRERIERAVGSWPTLAGLEVVAVRAL